MKIEEEEELFKNLKSKVHSSFTLFLEIDKCIEEAEEFFKNLKSKVQLDELHVYVILNSGHT